MKAFLQRYNILRGSKALADCLFSPVRNLPLLFAFTWLMSFLITVVGNVTGVYSNLFMNLVMSPFEAYLVCVLALLLGRIRLSIVVVVLNALVLMGELFCVLFYHSQYSTQVLQMVLETTADESGEFLQSALTQSASWTTIALTALCILLLWMLSRTRIRKYQPRWGMYLLLAVILYAGIRQKKNLCALPACLAAQTTAQVNLDNFRFNTTYVRFCFGILYNHLSTREIGVLEQAVRRSQVTRCTSRCPLIVLIIGESFNKYHASLYVPDYLKTTPGLDQLQAEGTLQPYYDAVSPYNITSNVFKNLFSTWDRNHRLNADDSVDDWTQHSLFPALFKKAGYQVYFITNQFVPSSMDMHNMTGGTIFNHPALSDLQFTHRNEKQYDYDGDLMQEIPSRDSLTARPTLLIVHLMGQHVHYAERFPASCARFTAEDARTTFGGQTARQIEADYANATLYNDSIVSTLMRRFAEDDALCVYLADHGEEVFDWRDQYERTNEDELLSEVMKYQYEIPLMFYLPEPFTQQHPELSQRIRERAHAPFISSNLPHTLLYLGGIETSEYQSRLNILSDDFESAYSRILREEDDYDKKKLSAL